MAKFYYNGVLLPALPTEHLATNPYAFIRKNNTLGTYDLVLGESQWYYENSVVYTTNTRYWYQIPISDSESYTEWTFKTPSTSGYGLDSNRTILWSLQDISNGSGSTTVYFFGTSPIAQRYLIRNNDAIYTIQNDSLVEVVGDLNAQLFIDNGVEDIPSGTLLMTLSNPEVLAWIDSETVPTLTATVKGIPQPQTIISQEIELMDGSIKGINGVTIECKGEPIFAVSFDKKATWMMHNGTEFVEVSDKLAGMTKTEFEAITTDQWQPKYEASSEMYIRCAILDETQSITTVNIDFIN